MDTQVKVEDISAVTKRVSVTIMAEEAEKELDKAYRQLKKSVKIKGFRPGKAPRSVLERHYGDRVNVDVANNLISQSYPEIIDQQELKTVATPTIEGYNLEPGANFNMSLMNITVRPNSITIDNLRSINISISPALWAPADGSGPND